MLNLFFLGDKDLQPWYDDLVPALPKGHKLKLYDPNVPLEEQIADADVIIDEGIRPITEEVVDAARMVKFIQRLGTGMDHANVRYILSKGILLANTPGQFSGVALAEHALLLMLSLSKQMNSWNETIRNGIRASPCGDELFGKTLGIIGLGASGGELAKRAKAFGMKVIAVDIREIEPSKIKEADLDFFGGTESLDKLLTEADYVSVHVPLTRKTLKMIGRRELGLMKKTARLINVARGAIVDEQALLEALMSGQIAGAGLDVFSSEPVDPNHQLVKLKNVVTTPHIAGVTRETSKRRSEVVGENIARFLKGLPPLYAIKEAE